MTKTLSADENLMEQSFMPSGETRSGVAGVVNPPHAHLRDKASRLAKQARGKVNELKQDIDSAVHEHPGMTYTAFFLIGCIAGAGGAYLYFRDGKNQHGTWKSKPLEKL